MALTQDALRFLYSTTGRHGRMVLDLGHPLPRSGTDRPPLRLLL